MRPGLDLHLGHDGVAEHPADQAAEPVPDRVADHRPVIGGVVRLGQLARKPGQLGPVDGQPPGGVGGRLDPAPIGPAAQGVIADPDQVSRLPDPERRHHLTLTQIRPKITSSLRRCGRRPVLRPGPGPALGSGRQGGVAQMTEETQFVPGSSGYAAYGPDQVVSWPYYGLAATPDIDPELVNASPVVTYDTIPLGEVEVRRGDT